jgi:hypothetical protein
MAKKEMAQLAMAQLAIFSICAFWNKGLCAGTSEVLARQMLSVTTS